MKFPFFDSFSTLFLTFWTRGRKALGTPFQLRFPTLGPKGPRTPLGGIEGSQPSWVHLDAPQDQTWNEGTFAKTALLRKPALLVLAPANLQKCVGGFLLYKFWRIFAGIFLEDFSGHFFPTKMRRKNPARKSAKKSAAQKKKIREKSVLPKAGPNWFLSPLFRKVCVFDVSRVIGIAQFESVSSKGAKGIPRKGIGEKVLNVMNFRIFQGVFRVFSGSFGCFQGVFGVFFPYALSGYALWTRSGIRIATELRDTMPLRSALSWLQKLAVNDNLNFA